jgi:enoyl-CoA hydratase
VNALNIGLYRDIESAFTELDDPDVHVAIFTGAGRVFCAGRDLKTSASEDPEERAKWVKRALAAIYHCAVPVIAAVNGPAAGAGFVAAILADIIVASDRAMFTMPEIDAGANPSIATILRGFNQFQARAMAFTGERYSPEDMQRMGIVRRVVPHDDLLTETRKLAEIIAAKNPLAMRSAKWSANEVELLFANFEQAYRAIEARVSAATLVTDQAKEAAKAFAEKRGPLFRPES